MSLALTSLLLCSMAMVTVSYPFGSPACVSEPRHGGKSQADRKSLGVTFSKEKKDVIYILTLEATPSSPFKGFLVQTSCPGEFKATHGVAVVECTGALGSAGPGTKAVTHTDSSEKEMVEIEFVPEDGDNMEPEFEIVIARNYTTFWTDIIV
eukprot:TRINITY_DN9657_c0_g1_i1.p1 TRINITY_DN9657_c0_g1~~TRINITY_DN9657_c0_g1_i1.p1  ORF type:complete len:152 (-),score=39.32 TRINITY_DN9657_c0_g1_i1:57-512(-)